MSVTDYGDVDPPYGWQTESPDTDIYWVRERGAINDNRKFMICTMIHWDGIDIHIPWFKGGWITVDEVRYARIKVLLECL